MVILNVNKSFNLLRVFNANLNFEILLDKTISDKDCCLKRDLHNRRKVNSLYTNSVTSFPEYASNLTFLRDCLGRHQLEFSIGFP